MTDTRDAAPLKMALDSFTAWASERETATLDDVMEWLRHHGIDPSSITAEPGIALEYAPHRVGGGLDLVVEVLSRDGEGKVYATRNRETGDVSVATMTMRVPLLRFPGPGEKASEAREESS